MGASSCCFSPQGTADRDTCQCGKRRSRPGSTSTSTSDLRVRSATDDGPLGDADVDVAAARRGAEEREDAAGDRLLELNLREGAEAELEPGSEHVGELVLPGADEVDAPEERSADCGERRGRTAPLRRAEQVADADRRPGGNVRPRE